MLEITDIPLHNRMKGVCLVAAQHAGDVDRQARFPIEVLDELRRARLLAVMIPRQLGGEQAGLEEVADLCRMLSQHCASAGMVYAMHNIKLHNLLVGGAASDWHRQMMQRIADEQLLLGSATTEAGIGGDLRNSICAVERDGDGFHLRKEATVISYALHCDAIFATARRAPDAASSDQVMVALLKDQYTLAPTHAWDTLGMRGTCSEGFILEGLAPCEQIFPQPFAELAAQSMLAAAHILWSSVWYGIAQDAWGRAQSTVRAEARRRPDGRPPSTVPLAEANIKLHQVRASIVESLERFARVKKDPDALGSISFAIAMNNLKVTSSRLCTDVVMEALRVAGIQGYRNDSPASVGRHLRDVLSAPLMIANDRVVSNLSSSILASKFDASLLE
ncbi:MAG: acyl-CoA/acyl-ACP dehydrogenase [Hyphomicrobiaceae bacterium]|nr:acyl-CoA/acyl-ACP dehydrogenase [Hyphomicrobiaceae bacterium]